MNTGSYITSDDILFKASAMAGDKDYKSLPKGFYYSLIQQAFEELNLDSFFQELRVDLPMPMDTLTLPLPEGCFNIRNIYIFNGDKCNIDSSRKVWHKRNYFTRGSGFIANDKGNDTRDPYYSRGGAGSSNKSLPRDNNHGVNSALYYNIQMGDLMLSSSCRGAGTMVHIHYNGTGCAIGEAPIIPVYFRTAMEHYVIVEALLYRMANDSGDIRKWQMLYSTYEKKLDRDGYDGSWHKAIQRVKSMNTSEREELKEYLSRGGWANGF
jgi:hypothetical protein